MYGVNAGMQAWNWTTGRTKADLALCLAYTAPFMMMGDGFYNLDFNSKASCLISASAFLFGAHLTSKRFIEEERKEASTLTNSLKDLEVESSKETSKIWGPTFSALGFYGATGEHKMLGLGEIVFGASFYVMRAETLPPRKDCVSRVLEGLTKTNSTSPIKN